MRAEDIELAKDFADQTIGLDYYSTRELGDIFERSQLHGEVCSLVLEDKNGQLRGIRITFPPGRWSHGKGEGLTPSAWNISPTNTAYFQSLFIDPKLAHQGWGTRMSLESIKILQRLGALAIVSHSWKESPNDSSGIYLRSLGFKLIATHPFYWREVNYVCPRCGKPCLCTAEEMIKYL